MLETIPEFDQVFESARKTPDEVQNMLDAGRHGFTGASTSTITRIKIKMKYFITTVLSALFLIGASACSNDEATTAPPTAVGDAIKVDHDVLVSDSEDSLDQGEVVDTTADTANAADVSVEVSDSSE